MPRYVGTWVHTEDQVLQVGLLGPGLHFSQILMFCLLTLSCPALSLHGGHEAYREPYLFVTHFNSLEVIEIQARSSLG